VTLTFAEKIEGGLLGLLIGDALGVPYEFHSASEIPALSDIEFEPPSTFRRAHDVPPGTWSDDGAQALVLLASLNDCSKLDLDDFARRLVNWYEHGYMAVDNYVFDVGNQTSQAIDRLVRGVSPIESGGIERCMDRSGLSIINDL
jgi:ADP-ribosyl-[dinitrogen reductase] hydrolase